MVGRLQSPQVFALNPTEYLRVFKWLAATSHVSCDESLQSRLKSTKSGVKYTRPYWRRRKMTRRISWGYTWKSTTSTEGSLPNPDESSPWWLQPTMDATSASRAEGTSVVKIRLVKDMAFANLGGDGLMRNTCKRTHRRSNTLMVYMTAIQAELAPLYQKHKQ